MSIKLPRARTIILAAAVTALVGGCSGESDLALDGVGGGPGATVPVVPPGTNPEPVVDPVGGGGGGGGVGSPDSELPKLDCSKRQAASSSVRRLTRAEYVNTVRDLLQDPTIPAPELAQDGRTSLFTGNAATPMSSLAARRYLEAAESLSARVIPKLGQLVPCSNLGDEACAAKFVKEFGRRAFRRPLTPAEQDRFIGIYSAVRSGGDDHAASLRWVVAAFMQSPTFLHHIEQGDPSKQEGEVVPLTPHEIASRLSYFYWKTMPDAALMAAADSGALATPEGIATQAQRLLDDPRARHVVLDFHSQLLELERLENLAKDPTMFPAFGPALRDSMKAETEKFIDFVYWEGDRKLSTLLTADFSFIDERLANIYGVGGVTGTALTKVTLPAGQRSGLLTQPSFLALNALADQTSPVFRGKYVRERMLCQELGAPPPGVETLVDPPTPGLSTRERFAEHSTNAACAGCHKLMDPIGFGFENYDAIGAYRTDEYGVPVDASGEIVNGGEVSGAFVGAVAMGAKLAESHLVKACVAEQWLSYAAQRGKVARDACAAEHLAEQFIDAGGDLRALLLAIPLNDAFRYRAPIEPETCQ